jgi:hypothetical protein
MDWNEIFTQIILGVVGIVISALGTLMTYWIAKKVKDDKAREILLSLNKLVQDSVLEIYQTYVEALKKGGMFDANAQKEALERCLSVINTNMPSNVKTWLEANYDDVEAYLKTLIEAQVALMKR